jgi:Uma2 family endonuclease
MRWTSSDLELLPEDGKRREIIDGELYVSTQPHIFHQDTCARVWRFLQDWSDTSKLGSAYFAPGVIFADDDDVAPDVIWISNRRKTELLRHDGHVHGPPELVVEVLSPGSTNEQRDREAKLKLYSRRGVDEYWIVEWRARTIEVFRRDGPALEKAATLAGTDELRSPLLPGFETAVDQIFVGVSDVRDDSPSP